jgi:hypothetical protein
MRLGSAGTSAVYIPGGLRGFMKIRRTIPPCADQAHESQGIPRDIYHDHQRIKLTDALFPAKGVRKSDFAKLLRSM